MVDFVKPPEDEDKQKGRNKKKPIPPKNPGIFNWKSVLITIVLIFLISSIISNLTYQFSPKIAVVPIKGTISTERDVSLYGSTISSRDIANRLYSLKQDSSVKGVVLDINSPGGSPVASAEISKAIDSVKKEKPVYSVINDVGASGAYWVAASTNKIYSSPMSTVGSIGVTSASLGFEDFIKEHNISYRGLTAGKYKDMGTPYRNLTKIERDKLNNILTSVHEKFITHIVEERELSYEKVRNYSTGEIFLGDKAKEIGFIDEEGYYKDTIQDMKNKTGDYMVVHYGQSSTFLEQLGVSSLFSSPTSLSSSPVMVKR